MGNAGKIYAFSTLRKCAMPGTEAIHAWHVHGSPVPAALRVIMSVV
jgi:hypothetical protein